MAEFCKCGSLIINNVCSNKNCQFKSSSRPGVAAAKTAAAGRTAASGRKKEAKPANPRRASKVITYNLYDTEDKVEEKYDETEDEF